MSYEGLTTTSPATGARFEALVNEMITRAKIRADLVVRKIAFDAYTSVIRRTPVDTGRARASWQLALDVPNLAVADVAPDAGTGFGARRVEKVQRRGSAPVDQVEAAVKTLREFRWGRTVYISNNLPYIVPLENGHSTQAPYGMVRLTMIAVEGNLQKAVNELRTAA